MYDIIVIGSGPAGLTAALYGLRAGKKVLILEKGAFGGQVTFSPKIENIPGFNQISGNEFADKFVSQVIEQGADIELDTVTGIIDNGETKSVITEYSQYDCKAVIIATGVKHRMLGLDREDNFVGNGISFCAVCDGAFYKGQEVALIGGGNSALQEALLLSEGCKKVTVVQNLDFLTGEDRLQEQLKKKDNVEIIYGTTVKSIIGEDKFQGIEIEKTATKEVTKLYCDGMFIAIGLIPENKIFDKITKLDNYGYIIADEKCLTDTDGIFVAGDCRTKSIRQITTATADGATAALSACKYIDNRK